MNMNKDYFQSFAMAKAMIRTMVHESDGRIEVGDEQIRRLEYICRLLDQVIRKIPTCDGMTFEADDEHHGIIITILTGYYEDYEIKECLIELIRRSDRVVFESIDSKTVATEFGLYNLWN